MTERPGYHDWKEVNQLDEDDNPTNVWVIKCTKCGAIKTNENEFNGCPKG